MSDEKLRSSLIRLAHARPELRGALLPLLSGGKRAMEFPSEDARQKYFKDHPDADRSKHTVADEDKQESNRRELERERENTPMMEE
jgi:hypothetical protein